MMNLDKQGCSHECREDIPWYLNGTLSEEAAAAVHEHVQGCDDCQGDLKIHEKLQWSVQDDVLTPMLPPTTAEDIMGKRSDVDSVHKRRRRAGQHWYAVAAAIAILGVALVMLLPLISDDQVANSVFTTATSNSSVAGLDYVLRIQFEDDFSTADRGKLAGQLEGAVRWKVSDNGTFEVHVQLDAPSLDVLQEYEARVDALAGVQSAEFTALQLPMR